jgi:multiple sugar transport system substrate-binding protein
MRTTIVGKIMIITMAAALLLTGCASGGQPMPTPAPVTLCFGVPFQASNTDPLLVQAIERFEQEHPHIAVEIKGTSAAPAYYPTTGMIEALQLDVFIWGPDPTLIAGEQPLVMGLEPFIGGTEGFAEEDFLPHLMDIFRWEGQPYAIPADVDVGVMYYNRDLFDAQGVAYPQPDWDWQDFLNIAQQLTTVTGEGEQQSGHWGFIAHSIAGDIFPFVLQHGGTLFDDPFKPTRLVFDDPLAAEAVQWYADLGLEYKVMPIVERYQVDGHSRVPTDKFSLQEAAMVIDGVGVHGGDIVPWDFEWGAVPLPRDQTYGTWAWPRAYFIAARTAHPQEARALVRSLSESAQEVTGLLPARRSVAESDGSRQRMGPALADAALAAFDSDALAVVWYWNDAYFNLYRGLVDQSYWAIIGDATAAEMMDRLQKDLAGWTMGWP